LKAIVIGSGFAGLSCATCLATEGWEVTVLEKNASFGGRARQFAAQGFTFDMGPSWYWMPDVFEAYFNKFGKSVADYYELERLDPSYKIVWGQDDETALPASVNELCKLFESLEAGSGPQLMQFLEEAKFKYQVGINDLVYKPGRSIFEFTDLKLLYGILKMDVFNSIAASIKKRFKHPQIIQMLEFPVLFLGALPENTPALYSLMNYADIALGTWYPKGGMCKIVEAMLNLAQEKGVKLLSNKNVSQIQISQGKATKVITQNAEYEADVVISTADYEHTESKLLEAQYQSYSAEYWDSRVMAPSSLLFYLGINKKIQGLGHHTLYFDVPFEQHAREIYETPQWPTEPMFYVNCTSSTDPSTAPEGCENIFILIPVAIDLKDEESTREYYYNLVLDRLEKRSGQSIKEHVVFKRSFAHNDFISDYNAFKGNAYGLANTLMQTSILKPSLKSKKVSNLFYAGQLTVPGPGVPPSLISGQVVAKEVIKEFKHA
jgi:phytoene desaturase